MKFEDIQRVNETISTTDIKGKEYAEVNQRIKAFRMLYPDGCIKTEIVSLDNGVCVMRAYIYEKYFDADDFKLLGTGTAYEKENSTFINKTSYIENCETSAVGRALAMCGIGIDTSIASAEEVTNAINNQNKEEINYRDQLVVYCNKNGADMNNIAKEFKLNAKSTNERFKEVLKILSYKDFASKCEYDSILDECGDR